MGCGASNALPPAPPPTGKTTKDIKKRTFSQQERRGSVTAATADQGGESNHTKKSPLTESSKHVPKDDTQESSEEGREVTLYAVDLPSVISGSETTSASGRDSGYVQESLQAGGDSGYAQGSLQAMGDSKYAQGSQHVEKGVEDLETTEGKRKNDVTEILESETHYVSPENVVDSDVPDVDKLDSKLDKPDSMDPTVDNDIPDNAVDELVDSILRCVIDEYAPCPSQSEGPQANYHQGEEPPVARPPESQEQPSSDATTADTIIDSELFHLENELNQDSAPLIKTTQDFCEDKHEATKRVSIKVEGAVVKGSQNATHKFKSEDSLDAILKSMDIKPEAPTQKLHMDSDIVVESVQDVSLPGASDTTVTKSSLMVPTGFSFSTYSQDTPCRSGRTSPHLCGSFEERSARLEKFFNEELDVHPSVRSVRSATLRDALSGQFDKLVEEREDSGEDDEETGCVLNVYDRASKHDDHLCWGDPPPNIPRDDGPQDKQTLKTPQNDDQKDQPTGDVTINLTITSAEQKTEESSGSNAQVIGSGAKLYVATDPSNQLGDISKPSNQKNDVDPGNQQNDVNQENVGPSNQQNDVDQGNAVGLSNQQNKVDPSNQQNDVESSNQQNEVDLSNQQSNVNQINDVGFSNQQNDVDPSNQQNNVNFCDEQHDNETSIKPKIIEPTNRKK
ncbi:uncharacterized protein LOC5510073 [Nematostella vectensis]|uniref:uncharacterized protein LOC5510073 n=1 Tax=Nematostella vectensis TaxID=45351 RepID=UPI00207743F1|nr:uncharacterized protein LOC5510073 [Nematostella vectensis]